MEAQMEQVRTQLLNTLKRAKQLHSEGKVKAVIMPGNGQGPPHGDTPSAMWYPWLAAQLEAAGVPVLLTNFPDPLRARERIWKEFVMRHLHSDEHTLLIGHSSGAACALRLMEEHKFYGCVLLSAYSSDMGDKLERESGYFKRPFDWAKMRENTRFIVQFHSDDDPLVPLAEGMIVAEGLRGAAVSDSAGEFIFHQLDGEGHFQSSELPVVYGILMSLLDGFNDDDEGNDGAAKAAEEAAATAAAAAEAAAAAADAKAAEAAAAKVQKEKDAAAAAAAAAAVTAAPAAAAAEAPSGDNDKPSAAVELGTDADIEFDDSSDDDDDDSGAAAAPNKKKNAAAAAAAPVGSGTPWTLALGPVTGLLTYGMMRLINRRSFLKWSGRFMLGAGAVTAVVVGALERVLNR